MLPAGEKKLQIAPAKTAKADWDNFVQVQPGGVSSRWINTYLCY